MNKLSVGAASILIAFSNTSFAQSTDIAGLPKVPAHSTLAGSGTRVFGLGGTSGVGGGGNSINGQLLENYQQSTDELEVASLVNAKLQLLAHDIRRFAKVLQERAKETKWYIVPVAIDELPSEITGIGIRTDQTAVQIQKEVYVDQRLWKKMTPKEKADLVLHELVLAQYFVVKSARNTYFPGLRDALSMSDMRRISKLVKEYTSADMSVLGEELSARNFGSYLTLLEKIKIETDAKHTLKWTFQNYCIEQKPLLSDLTDSILDQFHMYYRFQYESQLRRGSPVPSLVGQRAIQKDETLYNAFGYPWLSLNDIFPRDLIVAQPTEPGRFFDYVYPGKRASTADAKAGQEACDKLKKFDSNKHVIVKY